jgi:hypothetical protein
MTPTNPKKRCTTLGSAVALLALAAPLHAQTALCPADYTGTGGAYYTVAVSDSVVSTHTQLYAALEVAAREETKRPGADVTVSFPADPIRVECDPAWTLPVSRVDTVMVHDTVYVVEEPAPDSAEHVDTTTAPPPPPTPAPGQFRRNMPAGLSIFNDYGFGDPPVAHIDGTTQDGHRLGASGWRMIDWGKVGGPANRITSASAPLSPPYMLCQTYPAHLSGSGTTNVYRGDIPSSDVVYFSWLVKWDSDFHHNSNSEKLLFFNSGPNQYFFAYHWNNEVIEKIRQTDGLDILEANQMGPDSFGHPMARPINGQWVEFELLFERSTGTVKWWTNGELRAHHTGRSFDIPTSVRIDSTWGGGGDKQGSQDRCTDHFTIAVK